MLAGFMLGVTTTFCGSVIFYIILTTLTDVGSFESVRTTEASQPPTTASRETIRPSELPSKAITEYDTHRDQQTPNQAYGRRLASSQNRVTSQHVKNLIRKLLMAKIRLAGIDGITNISDSWLEGYINARYALLSR